VLALMSPSQVEKNMTTTTTSEQVFLCNRIYATALKMNTESYYAFIEKFGPAWKIVTNYCYGTTRSTFAVPRRKDIPLLRDMISYLLSR
jgi:hypothetical protein